MDATEQVAEEFDRLIGLSPQKRAKTSDAEQLLWYVVTTRCAIDMGGFDSVFEQTLREGELALLVGGLRSIDEPKLADAFNTTLELLQREKFYDDRDMRRMPPTARKEMRAIEKVISDRLWGLDEKLAALLNAE